MKNVTLREVANEAGVSMMSVSKALNNKEGLSKETRKRILEVASRLGYRQNQVASSLRTGETRTIGVVLSDSAESVVARILRGIQDEARINNYSIITTNTDKQPELEYEAILSLIEKRIDGIILVAPKCYTEERINWIKGFGIATVIAMRHGENGENAADAVLNDNFNGGYEIVIHLLNKGCRRLAFLRLKNSLSSRERCKGCESALREFKLDWNDFTSLEVEPSVEAGMEAAKKLLKQPVRPDAIVCGCDTVAIGVIEVLHAAKVKIPKEVCVTGYDGIEFCAYLKTPLTTMVQPFYEIGTNSVQVLLDRINYPNSPMREIILKSKLVARESTGCVPDTFDSACK